MDLFYGVHPPAEVHIPEMMASQASTVSRSRSPSPLSLRDPQDDGDYDMGHSTDDDDERQKSNNQQSHTRAKYPQRASRPLPLSLAAASLDLPALTHARNQPPSPLSATAARRLRLGLADFQKGEEEDVLSANPIKVSPFAAEAPFDEGTPQRAFGGSTGTTPVRTPSNPAARHSSADNLEGSPSSSASRAAQVNAGRSLNPDLDEPPPCELHEPPSLKTFRRPSASTFRPVTSPLSAKSTSPAAGKGLLASPQEIKMLPFEDEYDEPLAEEKKTNDHRHPAQASGQFRQSRSPQYTLSSSPKTQPSLATRAYPASVGAGNDTTLKLPLQKEHSPASSLTHTVVGQQRTPSPVVAPANQPKSASSHHHSHQTSHIGLTQARLVADVTPMKHRSKSPAHPSFESSDGASPPSPGYARASPVVAKNHLPAQPQQQLTAESKPQDPPCDARGTPPGSIFLSLRETELHNEQSSFQKPGPNPSETMNLLPSASQGGEAFRVSAPLSATRLSGRSQSNDTSPWQQQQSNGTNTKESELKSWNAPSWKGSPSSPVQPQVISRRWQFEEDSLEDKSPRNLTIETLGRVPVLNTNDHSPFKRNGSRQLAVSLTPEPGVISSSVAGQTASIERAEGKSRDSMHHDQQATVKTANVTEPGSIPSVKLMKIPPPPGDRSRRSESQAVLNPQRPAQNQHLASSSDSTRFLQQTSTAVTKSEPAPSTPQSWPQYEGDPGNVTVDEGRPDPPPFSPAPQARSWMEEEELPEITQSTSMIEKAAGRLAPSPLDPPTARHRPSSPRTSDSHESVPHATVALRNISERQLARERIKNRIRITQSFDHDNLSNRSPRSRMAESDSGVQTNIFPEGSLLNPIQIRRTISLDIQRPASFDLDRSSSSLPLAQPENSFAAKMSPSSASDVGRRNRRLEMSQAEYIAMRGKKVKPMPTDEEPLLPVTGNSSSSSPLHFPPGQDAPGRQPDSLETSIEPSPNRSKPPLQIRRTIDPPREFSQKASPSDFPDGPSQRVTSLDRPHFPSPLSGQLGPPEPFLKSTSLDGRHFRTPTQPNPITAPSDIKTAEPPSLKRVKSVPHNDILTPRPVPSTPLSRVEEPPSLSRPTQPQEMTPRRSNSTTPPHSQSHQGPVAKKDSSVEKPHSSDAWDNDGDSTGSVDTFTLIASLDDLVKDLEGMADSLSGQDDAYSPRVAENHNTAEFFKPLLIQSINNDLGVPKGDIMVSLLNATAERSWASRVTESIWRCRTMRQNSDTKWLRQKLERKPGSPSRGRTSVAVDLDDNAIVGGIETVEETQRSALEHLKYDDFEDALSLYENIAGCYYRYFEGIIHKSQNLPHGVLLERLAYFKAFVGACLHNMGIIHLLRGEYSESSSCFERATAKRAEVHGVGSTDHLASFVKKAICQLALDDLVEAARSYEECLALAQKSARSISDQRQIAEILNNLACLAFIAGRPEKALDLFKEAWNSQSVALDHSLYAGARFSCHSSTLNMSITRGNIGFLAILGRDIPAALQAFEYCVNQQQLLLRDAHRTLISSMDHLVIVQVILGNKEKAIRLLRRMYLMQVDAFGSEDKRTLATNEKISMMQETGTYVSSDGDRTTATETAAEVGSIAEEKDIKSKTINPVMKIFKKISKKK